MLWPLPATQWHLHHDVQGLVLFELTHICWSTLGTEAWGCLTVIFRSEEHPNPPSFRADGHGPRDDRHRLDESRSAEPLIRSIGTSNKQAEANGDHHIECIQQDTISTSVSHMETWKKESYETPKIGSQSSQTVGRVWESRNTETEHQTRIQWDVTQEVTQQIEIAHSEGQEDSRPNSHVWIEGPWRNDVAADDEEKDCVTPPNTPCH